MTIQVNIQQAGWHARQIVAYDAINGVVTCDDGSVGPTAPLYVLTPINAGDYLIDTGGVPVVLAAPLAVLLFQGG